jgi:hypothetical protein
MKKTTFTPWFAMSAAAGFYGVVNASMFSQQSRGARAKLMIFRIGWRAGSEYVFCNHVRISRDLRITDKDIFGVRDPQRCHAYSNTDRALLDLADELHGHVEVARSTWTELEKTFARDELVELCSSQVSGGSDAKRWANWLSQPWSTARTAFERSCYILARSSAR